MVPCLISESFTLTIRSGSYGDSSLMKIVCCFGSHVGSGKPRPTGLYGCILLFCGTLTTKVFGISWIDNNFSLAGGIHYGSFNSASDKTAIQGGFLSHICRSRCSIPAQIVQYVRPTGSVTEKYHGPLLYRADETARRYIYTSGPMYVMLIRNDLVLFLWPIKTYHR